MNRGTENEGGDCSHHNMDQTNTENTAHSISFEESRFNHTNVAENNLEGFNINRTDNYCDMNYMGPGINNCTYDITNEDWKVIFIDQFQEIVDKYDEGILQGEISPSVARKFMAELKCTLNTLAQSPRTKKSRNSDIACLVNTWKGQIELPDWSRRLAFYSNIIENFEKGYAEKELEEAGGRRAPVNHSDGHMGWNWLRRKTRRPQQPPVHPQEEQSTWPHSYDPVPYTVQNLENTLTESTISHVCTNTFCENHDGKLGKEITNKCQHIIENLDTVIEMGEKILKLLDKF